VALFQNMWLPRFCMAMNSPCITMISVQSLVINLHTTNNDFLTAYGVCVCVCVRRSRNTHTQSTRSFSWSTKLDALSNSNSKLVFSFCCRNSDWSLHFEQHAQWNCKSHSH
jgi:hypothetical protein